MTSLEVKVSVFTSLFSCYFYMIFFSTKKSGYRLFLLHLAGLYLQPFGWKRRSKWGDFLRPIRPKKILTNEKDRTNYNNEKKERKRTEKKTGCTLDFLYHLG